MWIVISDRSPIGAEVIFGPFGTKHEAMLWIADQLPGREIEPTRLTKPYEPDAE